jgi:Saxitoxin biosynthesis operon protein SxtJ
MSLVSVNWNPSRKDLNGFRVIAVGAGLLAATLLYALKHVDLRWCLAIAAVGGGIGLSGFVSLKLTRTIYVVMMAVTLPIGFVMSLILMGVFFFGLITPVGLIFRLIGRDAMRRRFDSDASTYWIAHEQSTEAKRYFQQF